MKTPRKQMTVDLLKKKKQSRGVLTSTKRIYGLAFAIFRNWCAQKTKENRVRTVEKNNRQRR